MSQFLFGIMGFIVRYGIKFQVETFGFAVRFYILKKETILLSSDCLQTVDGTQFKYNEVSKAKTLFNNRRLGLLYSLTRTHL